MMLVVAAYSQRSLPATALTLPATGLMTLALTHIKKALRASAAGPVLFYRERKVALKISSTVCSGHQTKPVSENQAESLFGLLGWFVGCAVFGHGIVVKQVIHARNSTTVFFGLWAGLSLAVCHRIGLGLYFADFRIRCRDFWDFDRTGCIAGFFGADNRKRIVAFGLGHGNGGGGTGHKNKTRDGKCDFTTLGIAHGYVSLFLISVDVLIRGRVFDRVPLQVNVPAHCALKRDQLCIFQGTKRAKRSQLSPNTRFMDKSFLNASVGDGLRRVAHNDGLAYVRRNPIFDGDTAR